MEYWVSKAEDDLILTSDECHLYKNWISMRQTQYSNIPLFQYPMAFDYGEASYI